MRKLSVLFLLCVFVVALYAQWDPLNDYKMTMVQPPNPAGWDVNASALGADWICSEEGPVSAICIWYSWQGDVMGTINSVSLQICEDIPAGTGGIEYSRPGNVLWSDLFLFPVQEYVADGPQGWFVPAGGLTVPGDHIHYYRIRVYPNTPMTQYPGIVYWLVASFVTEGGNVGWKTTFTVFNDAGVWWSGEMWEPVIINLEPVDLAFSIGNPTLPVELSSFTAQVTSENFVQLAWTTQSETDMLGYNVLRADTDVVTNARQVNGELIPAHNQPMETHYSATDQEVVQNSTYWYWLESLEMNGSSNLHGPVSVSVVPGTPGGPDVPDAALVTALLGNYPNPFNPSTSIAYSLAKESAVEVAIYNTRGELVRTLQDYKPAGRHSIVWNGKDSAGMACASGVYFFHLRADGMEQVSKGILVK